MITNTNNMDMLDNLKAQFGDHNNEKLKEEENKLKNERRKNRDLQRDLDNEKTNLEVTECKNNVERVIGNYENKIELLAGLIELYNTKYKDVTDYFENIKDNTERNSRMAHFQFDKIKEQQSLLSFLRIIYYIVFVFWVLFSDYITSQKYFSIKYWIYIITYILIPLKLQTVVNFVYYIYINLKKYINIFIYELHPSSFMYSSI